ncbi:MAG: zinc metalloprotease HtpX [Candidatus Omnitrophica bacterium]|nr:zinc metalloprotease HtpX [Candidatus Omnitrophota bacterium]MCM8808812.1 zinc metalloprotease HtpX [Candidatus Omnitrophota bacterium]MCM8832691.1 zinc metalloprotease HtpX [Candidatus Omnitrophota bacterium]
MVNRIKTYFLLGILTLILIWIGGFFGREGLITALILAFLMNWISYFFSDKIILAMYRAREVKENEEPYLHSVVAKLAQSAGIPKPKIYIINSATPNAFATGRNPNNAVVALTTGILQLLDENELKGVIAHELTHIKNRDILVATIAATIAGAITFLARMLQYIAMFGSMNRDDRKGGNLFALAAILLFAILAPIAALIIQLAISRSREYLADEGGARISGNPLYLSNALRKLAYGVNRYPMRNANPSTSSLFIVNPFSGKSILNLFSTHPPIEERIKRLERMYV